MDNIEEKDTIFLKIVRLVFIIKFILLIIFVILLITVKIDEERKASVESKMFQYRICTTYYWEERYDEKVDLVFTKPWYFDCVLFFWYK